MWNKKKNTYDSTDVSYQGGMKYGSNIHQVAIKTNQIVWDMIKVLNKKGLFGFHFSSKLGTQKTIVNVFHNDKAMLSRAKRELQEFQSIDDLIIIYRVKQKKEKNYVKAAIILLLILATVGLAGAGIGYYLYAQTSFFAPDSQKKSAIVEQFDNNETKQTIEVDIQMLTALKESFEKQEKSESEKAVMQAMAITTDIISEVVPDSLKDKYSSEEVVNKFKGGGVNLALKSEAEGSVDLNQSIAELNAYAKDYISNHQYDKALGYYQKAIESHEENSSALLESYIGQGEIYTKSDQLKEAKISYENALALSKHLSKKDKIQYQNTQAWIEAKLSSIYHDLNQTKEAKEALEKAESIYIKTVDLFKRLAQEDPKVHQQNLAWAYNMLANFYHNDKQDSNRSLQVRQKALDIYKTLFKREPKRFFERLFRTYNSMGLSYQALKQYALAQKSYQKGFELIQSIREENSSDYKQHLAQALNLLGAVYAKLEKHNQAYKHLKQAESLYKQLLFEDSYKFKPFLLSVQQDIASLYVHQKEYAKAWRLYQDTFVKYQGLLDKKPLHYNMPMAKILNSMAWIALVDEKMQKKSQVRRLLRESLSHSKELQKINRFYYASLGFTSYLYLAYLSIREGNILESFKHYERALSLKKDYDIEKSYLLFLISQKSFIKANERFNRMLKTYTSLEEQAELWMLYGKFYMEIDLDHAKLKLERSLALYQELNDTLKIAAINMILDQNSSNKNNSMVQ